MTTPRPTRAAATACGTSRKITTAGSLDGDLDGYLALHAGRRAEMTMAWLVLIAIAMSILGGAAGFAAGEGAPKNGVRRAASQLERKVVKGEAAALLRASRRAAGWQTGGRA